MKKGAGAGEHGLNPPLPKAEEQREALLILISPDILPIDETGKKKSVPRESMLENERLRPLPLYKVKPDPIKGELRQSLIDIPQIPEIGLKQNPKTSLFGEELLIDREKESDILLCEIPHEAGLIKLKPLRPELPEAPDIIPVRFYEASPDLGDPLFSGKAKKLQKAEGPDQDRLCLDAKRKCLRKLQKGFFPGKADLRIILQLRDDIVVIGVKPLLHGERLHTPRCSPPSPGHGKAAVQRGEIKLPISGRDQIKKECRIQNPIIKGEVVRRDEIDPLALHLPPLPSADPGCALSQRLLGELCIEILLHRKLELPLRSHPGEGNHRCLHGFSLSLYRCIAPFASLF